MTIHLSDIDFGEPPTKARVVHFIGQLTGNVSRSLVPSGLSHLLHLPPTVEARTIKRARMAAEIERCVSSLGCVTRENLEAAGFDDVEIADLFTEARRIARVERMVA